ncbi:unnamed protein product [Brassica oleracea]
MMLMRRKLGCCSREREMSIDFDEQDRMITYNGLEACIINNQSYEEEEDSGTRRGDGCLTDSLDDDAFSSCSSSKEAPTMKEKCSKRLLGEDVTGGCKCLQVALALSNAITHSIFGELWKLEPLCEKKKQKWRREMDWLLSPTNYMIELVPSKHNDANGRSLEVCS